MCKCQNKLIKGLEDKVKTLEQENEVLKQELAYFKRTAIKGLINLGI